MNHYKIAPHTLQALLEQVGQSSTITLSIRTPQQIPLKFSLDVERGESRTLFTIRIEGEHHTLTLLNDQQTARKLADFIEEITNGSIDASDGEPLPVSGIPAAHAV